jgi:hypothetical protein
MRSILFALCAVNAVLGVTTTSGPTRKVTAAPSNPQQQQCAQPPKKCGSQAKEQSCINWHGCKWVDNVCYYDETCETTKATVVPTTPPVPTVPTVPHRSPTVAPSKCTLVPPSGQCFDLKTLTDCEAYKCCTWNGVARPQRCQYQDLPTSAPTPPTTPKPTVPVVCMSLATATDCKAQSTCSWCRKCSKNKCRQKA